MNESKRCKDCKYAFETAVDPNDIWCDLDKLDYSAKMQACQSFEEEDEEE